MKRKKSELNKALGIFTITFFSLSMIFLVYAVLFASKALPNTYFTNFNVAGRNIEQISKVVDNRIESFETEKITILAGNAKIELLPHELGIDFDNEISKQNIFDLFIADNPLEDYGNRMTALFFKKKIKPSYKVDYSKLSNLLDEKFADIEKKASDATISFGTGEVEILKEKNGVVVDRTKLVSDLVSRLDNFSNAPIIATYIEDKPKIKNENAKAAFEKVKTLNNQNIILSYGFDTWTITGETLADLLKFYARGQIDNNLVSVHLSSTPLIINDVNFKGKEQPALEVQLDNEKLALFIEEIAIVVDKPTVDATLELDGVKVSKFTPAQDGQALDKTLTKDLILNVVSVDNLDSREEVAIKLPVNVTKARIANEEINSLGIRELVASGNSYFAGSIPNRVFNIGLGASLINGTLVPPGEVFSFNSIVGPVSAEQGFKQAYVINKGRTVLDDGGGICQVSTTVFRAALNAGLPIEARTAHAYRVAYYEQRGFAPGFDATIWSPTVDLKFKNDTGHHILVQAIVDRAQSKLQVDIYGTSDGRNVEISDPVLSTKRPAPEPLYQDDPALPKGTTKQVDFAAEGLTSVFSRKVYKGDALIIDDTFKSNFRPWQAVYLVGTGT